MSILINRVLIKIANIVGSFRGKVFRFNFFPFCFNENVLMTSLAYVNT